ncbi:MAG: hypothetical protein GY774_34695 [Planctomycetes bacterium]|nr:hypothetical protein [Planctomycetota bacterium]
MMKDLLEHAQSFAEALGPLSQAEVLMLGAAQSGGMADCAPGLSGNDPSLDPAQHEQWSNDRRIRSWLLHWILRNETTRELIDPKGIAVSGAAFVGHVNICSQIVTFPLHLLRCALPDGFSMTLTDVQMISLEGSWVKGLYGDHAIVRGNLCLNGGFRCLGEVSLKGAKVGGNLDCAGGYFENVARLALVADGAEIGGSAMFCREFSAYGTVRLVGTKVGRDLDCGGGRFTNPQHPALHAEGAIVDGSVMLCESSRAPGLDEVIGARTGSDQFMRQALQQTKGFIDAKDYLQQAREILTRFESSGAVVLDGITIGGDLDCTAGSLQNAKSFCLSLSNAQVKGSVRCCGGEGWDFEAVGEIRLRGAQIGQDLVCRKALCRPDLPPSEYRKEDASSTDSTSELPEVFALNAESANILGSVVWDNLVFGGQVVISGARIGGQLTCNGTYVNPRPGGDALTATQVRVGGSVVFGKRQGTGMLDSYALTPVRGFIRLLGADIGGDLIINVSLEGSPGANGVAAQAAKVAGRLVWDSAWITKDSYLDLRDANAGSLVVNDPQSWPPKGNINLRGLVFDDIDYGSDIRTALRWVELQPFFSPQPYHQLAKALRECGNEIDAKKVLIAKERERRVRGNIGTAARWWSWLLGVTIGYGYRPHYALGWAAIIVVLGAVLIAGGQTGGLFRDTMTDTTKYSPLNPLVYSLDVFLPVGNLHQEDYWWPDSEKRCTKLMLGKWEWPCGAAMRVYLWFHNLAGWVLTTLFAAGLAGLVRKD